MVQISRARGKDFAFYVQDQWKPIDRLTLNLGLRVDWVRRHDDLFNLTRQSSTQIAPRFGFSLMLDRDASNVIRGSFVRLHAGMTGRDGPTRFVTASSAAIRTEFDNDLDGVFETVQQSLRQTESLVAQRFDPELGQPYIDEFILAYRRQFPGQVVLDIAGTLKHVENNYASVDINGIYPAGPGLPFLGFGRVDPNRGRVTQQTNNTWSRNNLWATDFTLTKNMTNNFMLYSTLGLQKHSISGDWNPTDPSRFISPEKFPNDRNLEDTRGNGDGNSLTRGSGGSVHVWQDYSYNFAGTWDAPGGIKLSSGYTLHQGRFTGVVKDRLAQADPTYGPTRFTLPNGTTQPNPLATRFRIFFPTRGEGQTKAPNIHSLNVKIGKVPDRRFSVVRDFRQHHELPEQQLVLPVGVGRQPDLRSTDVPQGDDISAACSSVAVVPEVRVLAGRLEGLTSNPRHRAENGGVGLPERFAVFPSRRSLGV